MQKIKRVQNLLEIFLARRTTRTTVTRVIAATMIEQRDGEVDAPARRKNLGIRCLRFVASLHLQRNQNTISLDAEEDKW